MPGYILKYAVVGGVFGPQLCHRTSYRLKVFIKFSFIV